jgi:hypothetical protein
VLKANTKKDIETFGREFYETVFQTRLQENVGYIAELINVLTEMKQNDISTIHNALFDCTSQSQIKNYPQYIGNILSSRKELCSNIMREMVSVFVVNSNEVLEQFVIMLNQEYSGLNALLPNNWKKEPKIDNISFDTIPDITISLPALDSDAIIGGGAVAGAAIGTAIMPGIGTVIGGLVGGFFGSLLGPDLNTVKHQVWNESESKITEQYDHEGSIINSEKGELKRRNFYLEKTIDERAIAPIRYVMEEYSKITGILAYKQFIPLFCARLKHIT